MLHVLMSTREEEPKQKAVIWDSDRQQSMVDNGASVSITPYLSDFIQPPTPMKTK